MKQNKMREEIINSFIDCLKKDIIPWHKSWSMSERPVNAVTDTPYHGVNAFWLSFMQSEKNYKDPRWCTFKQAQSKGWKIKAGSKGTSVEFWSLYDTEEKRKLTQREAAQLSDELTKEEFQKRIKPVSNTYTVFNGEQIEGIKPYEIKTYEFSTEEIISGRDTLLKNMNVGYEEGGDNAFYNPGNDRITLPEINRFESKYAYMATLLHEAGHATGHESRLGRNLNGIFGSPEYAKEELRAEIASAFTAQTLGLDYDQNEYMENHEAYVQNWISVLSNEPNELFAAIKDAEKISDYLIERGEFERTPEIELVNDENVLKTMDTYVAMHRGWIEEMPQKKIPLVLNAYGGPGAGKSVACLEICAALKKEGYTAEYVQEFAKELVYEKNFEMLDGSPEHQFEILKEQTRRVDRLYDQVDFIVTDSPIMLNTIYNKELTPEYAALVHDLNDAYYNFSFFMERDASNFEKEGRIHNLEESIQKDQEIKNMLNENGIDYKSYTHDTLDKIMDDAVIRFKQCNPEVKVNNKFINNMTLNFKNETDAIYVRNTENGLLSGAQAARFRMAMKGHERSLKEFLKDEKIPDQLKEDAISVGNIVKTYIDKGIKLENIITSSIGKIDKEAVINDTAYTKNLVCSLYSTTNDEYMALKKLPDLWNRENLVNISGELAGKLMSEQVTPIIMTDDKGIMKELNNPKNLYENRGNEFYINDKLFADAIEQYHDISPVVKCEWSEAEGFDSGKIYTLKEYDELMRTSDFEFSRAKERARARYETDEDFLNTNKVEDAKYTLYQKNKYIVDFGDGRTVVERQDIGDNEGGLIEHFTGIQSLNVYTDEMKNSIQKDEEFNLFQEKLREVYEYEEANDIPEDFRTTSSDMEVISKDMVTKQYELLKGLQNKEQENLVSHIRKSINKSPIKSRGIEM